MSASRLNAPSATAHPQEIFERKSQLKRPIQNMVMLTIFSLLGYLILGTFMFEKWWYAIVVTIIGLGIGFLFPTILFSFFGRKKMITLMWIHDKVVTYFGILATIPTIILISYNIFAYAPSFSFNWIVVTVVFIISMVFALIALYKDLKQFATMMTQDVENQ
jgi:hypothetical protein